ncbi:MAG: hypothetical protein ACTSYR_02505 [Candidatus Odinarchaeia archaeon]
MSWRGRGQGRYRNMYYLTGLPGFIRFGYSPGWIGRSPTGLGPMAQYLADQGLLEKYISDQIAKAPQSQSWYPTTGLTKDQRLNYLKTQQTTLKSYLEQIEKEIEKLEKEE